MAKEDCMLLACHEICNLSYFDLVEYSEYICLILIIFHSRCPAVSGFHSFVCNVY